MRKFVVLLLLGAAVMALVAASASATPRGSNGLISFTRFNPALQQDVVYTINPNGTGERSLFVGGESGQWSPDGRRLAVIPDNQSERIVNPDNGSYTELPTFYSNPDLFLPCGVWSPDGSRLACEGFGDDPSADGVYTIRSSDGGGVRRVTSGADDDDPGDYSPNGQRLVFSRSSFDAGTQALYVVDVNGSHLRQLTPDRMRGLLGLSTSWSPQGNEILFSSQPAEGQRSAIFIVHADGSGLRQIPISGCGSTVGCFGPVWSPDGTKIAFTRFDAETGQADLYTVKPDGTGLFQVTHTGLGAGLTDWGTHSLNR